MSKRQLLISTLGALAAAGIILVLAVLPAEFGIDPTGIGKLAGLTAMASSEGDTAVPAMHAAAHQDASEPEHACCVTMFEAGNFHAPTVHADFTARPDMQFVERVEPFIERIAAVRFSLGVLEHAPPATV